MLTAALQAIMPRFLDLLAQVSRMTSVKPRLVEEVDAKRRLYCAGLSAMVPSRGPRPRNTIVKASNAISFIPAANRTSD